MRNIAFVLLAASVGLSGSSYAQQLPDKPPVFAVPASNRTASEVDADVSNGAPVIDVMVNGKGPFRFFVDTGGLSYAYVAPSLLAKLGLPAVEQGGRLPFDDVRIGDTRFQNVEAILSIPQAIADRRGVDGMLGMALFQDYVLSIDYAAKKLALRQGVLSPGSGVVPFTREDGFINVKAVIGEYPLRLHVDTGNSTAALAVPEDVVAALSLSGQPRIIGQARSWGKSFDIKALPLQMPLKVGDVAFTIPDITFPSPVPVGNIGGKAFENMVLEVDQKNNLLRFSRPS